MQDIEHIALRLRKARLALDAINDRAQLAKDDAAPMGGGQPAASSTTDDVHVAGLAEVVRRKKRVEALAQKSAELLAKYNPYHGPNGRFTGPGGATFVSTTNKRTTERMRTGQMSGGAGPKAAPASTKPVTPDKSQMVGTPKQIDYAHDVRSKAVANFQSAAKNLEVAAKEFRDDPAHPIATSLAGDIRHISEHLQTTKNAKEIIEAHSVSGQHGWEKFIVATGYKDKLERLTGDKKAASEYVSGLSSIAAGG